MITRIIILSLIAAFFSCSPPRDEKDNSTGSNPVFSDTANYEGKVFLQKEGYYKKLNTELGMLHIGNFDFYFDGKKVTVTTRFKFSFENTIPAERHEEFKQRFFRSIKTYWSDAKVDFVRETGTAYPKTIPFEIIAYEDTLNYHKLVDVHKNLRRAHVFMDMNIDLDLRESYIAHEFGHVLGLYDNYDGGKLENAMLWHDNRYIKDVNSMMNRGVELRKRYFEHFLKELNSIVGDCRYSIRADFE